MNVRKLIAELAVFDPNEEVYLSQGRLWMAQPAAAVRRANIAHFLEEVEDIRLVIDARSSREDAEADREAAKRADWQGANGVFE